MLVRKYDRELNLNGRNISHGSKTYFIADIAANHDGDLSRALELIHLAKEAGADCAKFQHFEAKSIVSDVGFSGDLAAVSHQTGWKKSVYEIYDQYHTKLDWSQRLLRECKKAKIDFMTTPYNVEAVDLFCKHVPGFKIGSGDITYRSIIEKIAKTAKPVFLATGAADISEVIASVNLVLNHNPKICLMQCNTNYTGDTDNFQYVNLNVLKAFSTIWPGMVLGLSDHTPGHTAVLGAVSLGASVIEKHFTDDNQRIGPDHSFAMNPNTWRNMVDAVGELELAFGNGIKSIEKNEEETVIIQRRALRLNKDMNIGDIISAGDLVALRPCPTTAMTPMEINKIIGKKLAISKKAGEELSWPDLI